MGASRGHFYRALLSQRRNGTSVRPTRSESDGTITYGDHAFDRTSGRIQLLGPNSQTDLFAGYQDKYFGWPEMYAAPYGSNETENVKRELKEIKHVILDYSRNIRVERNSQNIDLTIFFGYYGTAGTNQPP